MIAIIDYKTGNIASLTAALTRLGQAYVVSNDPQVIQNANRVILPGVGRAKPAMVELTRLGLDQVIKELKVPVLGICLGMQLLAEWSEEDNTQCLGCIPAQVKRFQSSTLTIPQIGWNTVQQLQSNVLFDGIANAAYMYFVHSYYMEVGDWAIGTTQYAQTAATVVRWNNYYGVQFHPEKSGEVGLQMLNNFCTGVTEIWPAIDILNGKCVRLRQGEYSTVTQYSTDPIAVAKEFAVRGVTGIHVVDLDAAKLGKPVNDQLIHQLAAAVNVPIEVGGGIRSLEIATSYLTHGVRRVIIGTAAFTQPQLVRQLVETYGPERIVVGIDMKNGTPAIRGWQETVDCTLEQIVKQLQQSGITTVIVTDVSKDGMMNGPNVQIAQNISALGLQVIVSGGIRGKADIAACIASGARGVIIGKAMYEPPTQLTGRIIPCMDVANGRVVKGVQFTQLRDAGDPAELAKVYCEAGADELVFLDITATLEKRKTLYDVVKAVAKQITIPFTVGGGVRTVDDIRALLNAGADKVSIGSVAVTNPRFVQTAAEQFGSQCIVISVDAKKIDTGWEVYIRGGREATGTSAIDFAQDMEKLGAGELLVNSLDRDGTRSGYDIELLTAITSAVSIPVIASSGVGTVEDFYEAFAIAKVDAALAASVFHEGDLSVSDVKQYLYKQGISVRL